MPRRYAGYARALPQAGAHGMIPAFEVLYFIHSSDKG